MSSQASSDDVSYSSSMSYSSSSTKRYRLSKSVLHTHEVFYGPIDEKMLNHNGHAQREPNHFADRGSIYSGSSSSKSDIAIVHGISKDKVHRNSKLQQPEQGAKSPGKSSKTKTQDPSPMLQDWLSTGRQDTWSAYNTRFH